MPDMDVAIAARMAVTQQNANMSMIKHAADMQKQMADMIAETVAASNHSGSVDLYA